MDRDGVTRESINDKKVIVLDRFAFKRQTGITLHHLDLAPAFTEIGKVLPCEPFHKRVYFIKTYSVPRACVGGKGAGTQSYNAHLHRRTAYVFHCHPDT